MHAKSLVLMISIFSSILLMSVPTTAQPLESCAEAVELTWSAPTTRTDGTALPPDEVQGYILFIDLPLPQSDVNVQLGETSFAHENPISDCGAGQVNYSVAAVDTDNGVSAFTDEVTFVFDGGKQVLEAGPSAPSGLTGDIAVVPVVGLPACTSVVIENCTIESFTVVNQ